MTSFSDQLSAVRQSQWDTQLDILRALGNRALDNAEQIIALNIRASHASMEHAANTFRQVLDARHPRDLVAIGSNAQDQWQQMFAYSRELLGIATGARARWTTQPAPSLGAPAAQVVEHAPALLSYTLEQVAIAGADATTVGSETAAAAVDTGIATAQATLHAGTQALAQAGAEAEAATAVPAPPVPEVSELEAETTGAAPSEAPSAAPGADDEPAQAAAGATEAALEITVPPDAIVDAIVDQAISDEGPSAKAKPLAKALNKLAPKPAGAEHPLASTIPLENGSGVELPPVAPIASTPPVPVQAAPEPKPPRASRKK